MQFGNTYGMYPIQAHYTLSEGQELDSSLILKVFKLKALYVNPLRPLLLVRLECVCVFFFFVMKFN